MFDGPFGQLSPDPDFEGAMIDGSIVRVRRQGADTGGLEIRPSPDRGGLTARIVGLANAPGKSGGSFDSVAPAARGLASRAFKVAFPAWTPFRAIRSRMTLSDSDRTLSD